MHARTAEQRQSNLDPTASHLTFVIWCSLTSDTDKLLLDT